MAGINKYSEEEITKRFVPKNWTEKQASSSWMLFKIMAEFVDGFETLNAIGPCVSIFGSARTQPDNLYYQLAEEIAAKMVEKGYGVIQAADQESWKRPTKELRKLVENR